MALFPPEKEEDFAAFFPEEVLRRGLAYAREGRVRRVFRVGERLLGEVQGSEPRPYRVEVGPGLVGSCTCPYPFFPCKHAAALLYAYLERRPEDLWPRLEALSPEEAKGLLLRLATLPEVAFLLKELLSPEEVFAEGVRRLRQAFRLGGGEEEAKALLLSLPQAGREEVAAFLEALLEAPFDPGPYLGPVLRRYLDLGGELAFLLKLYLRHPFEALGEAFLALDPNLLEVARTLGVPRYRILARVVLPLVWPGLLSGTLLAFAHTLGEFGVVLMVGGSIPGKTQMVSIYLYDLVQALRFAEAARASLVLLGLSLFLLAVVRALEGRWRSWRSTTG